MICRAAASNNEHCETRFVWGLLRALNLDNRFPDFWQLRLRRLSPAEPVRAMLMAIRRDVDIGDEATLLRWKISFCPQR